MNETHETCKVLMNIAFRDGPRRTRVYLPVGRGDAVLLLRLGREEDVEDIVLQCEFERAVLHSHRATRQLELDVVLHVRNVQVPESASKKKQHIYHEL